MMSDENKVKSFWELLVWQKGIELAQEVCSLTRHFLGEEKCGLISQLRRGAASVPSDIVERQVRRSEAELAQFLSISVGSVAELETQLVIASKRGLACGHEVDPVLGRIHGLPKLLHSLRSKPTTTR